MSKGRSGSLSLRQQRPPFSPSKLVNLLLIAGMLFGIMITTASLSAFQFVRGLILGGIQDTSRLGGWIMGFKLAKRFPKPRETLPIDLRPTVYIILAAPGWRIPAELDLLLACSASRASSRSTLCATGSHHSRSLRCEAAGVALPSAHQWR